MSDPRAPADDWRFELPPAGAVAPAGAAMPAVLDFASLYPSALRRELDDPETPHNREALLAAEKALADRRAELRVLRKTGNLRPIGEMESWPAGGLALAEPAGRPTKPARGAAPAEQADA